MNKKIVIIFIILPVVLFLLVFSAYYVYCRKMYNRQNQFPQNNYFSNPQDVEDFIEKSGPYTDKDLERIRNAEKDAYMYPEWDKSKCGEILIEIVPGDYWNPYVEVVDVYSSKTEIF